MASYADERSALRNVLYLADNSEAFKEVHEDVDALGMYLDIMDHQIGKINQLPDAESDRGEIINRAHKLIVANIPKHEDDAKEGDVEIIEKAVTEKCYCNKDSNAEDLSYLNIPFSAIHLDGAIRELKPLSERKSQADAHLDGLVLVERGRLNGIDCAVKVFKSADMH